MRSTRKTDLTNLVSVDTGLPADDARRVIDAFLTAVAKELRNHNEVSLRGFGVFSVRARAPKPARNFQTGRAVQTRPGARTVFKPSVRLKSLVNAKARLHG